MLTLEEKLRIFIEEELIASKLYAALAAIAPNDNYKQLLQGMANDEEDHAKTFQKILYHITGQMHQPAIKTPTLRSTFDEILWNRVLDETSDYRKYGYEYFRTAPNTDLSSAYYVAKTDENVHAIRLLYMLLR